MDDENGEVSGMSRRDFLLSAANAAIFAALGLFIGFPIVEIFASHARKRGASEDFKPIAKRNELLPGQPLEKSVIATQYDAWNKQDGVNMGSVWLVKEEDGGVKAFSSICPHLGCIYAWNANDRTFICPCHDSGFALDGRVLKGPAPRGLDALEVKTEGEEVLVRYQRFMAGIPQKKVI